jgi:hypothetical protein
MKNPRNVVNLTIASLLLVAVTSLGIFVAKSVQADVVYPGYATANISLVINAQSEQDISVTSKFAPEDVTNENYNYKSRTFHVLPGQNNISWTVKRITPGTKIITVSADTGIFTKSTQTLKLESDKVTNTDTFGLTLGDLIAPVMPLPTQTQTTSATQGYIDSQLSPTTSPTASI